MNRVIFFFVFTSFWATIASSWAITPMDYYNSRVAGGDEAGFRDGAFSLARFNSPSGLAFDDTGNKLYVADPGNHCIREVDLDQNNEVKTLAGTGFAGAVDGPLPKATFNVPTLLAALPGNRLVVFDAGNGSIRLIDLQNQTIATIEKGINIRDMVYRQPDDCLYFSEPDNKKVEKMNMKSLAISEVFSNDSRVPSP
ncbi:MAG TPA: hypothetical protein VK859_03250, partial [bacterium]|nr:hypothetical protein [bacterium]